MEGVKRPISQMARGSAGPQEKKGKKDQIPNTSTFQIENCFFCTCKVLGTNTGDGALGVDFKMVEDPVSTHIQTHLQKEDKSKTTGLNLTKKRERDGICHSRRLAKKYT